MKSEDRLGETYIKIWLGPIQTSTPGLVSLIRRQGLTSDSPNSTIRLPSFSGNHLTFTMAFPSVHDGTHCLCLYVSITPLNPPNSRSVLAECDIITPS